MIIIIIYLVDAIKFREYVKYKKPPAFDNAMNMHGVQDKGDSLMG